jgi:5-methylcytosine-specific restriction endonuclease McrA
MASTARVRHGVGELSERVVRRVVMDRGGWVCALCLEAIDPEVVDPHAAGYGEVDHVVPLSLGGAHVYANVQPAHRRCNVRKGGANRLP